MDLTWALARVASGCSGDYLNGRFTEITLMQLHTR